MLWNHKLLIVIVLVSMAYAISYRVLKPQDNPNPSKHFLIRGQFPYSKGLTLTLQMSFNSSNPSCRLMARAFAIFPTAEANRSIQLELPVRQMAEDRYEAEMNIDHFTPGFCKWEYGGMSYQILGNNESDTNQHALGSFPHRAKSATLLCEYSNIPRTIRSHVYCRKFIPMNIEMDKHPSAELNFLWKEG